MDTNWRFSIPGAYGLDNVVWGGHVYSSVMHRFNAEHNKSDERGMVLHMATSPHPHPGHHRFPVWWTGDDKGLAYSIASMVQMGITELKPYVHSDCGSDGRTNAAEYVRWIQHCSMGSILRIHGGPPNYPSHQPWSYDNTTETIVRKFITMRHRLVPMLVAAGHQSTADGTPVVRRLDLEWPEFAPLSSSNTEYTLGDDLLLAPYTNGGSNFTSREVWIPPGEWVDAWTGAIVKSNGSSELIKVNHSLEQMPMWHRRGGITVTTGKAALNVAGQDWSELILETFPNRGQAAPTTRYVKRKQRVDDEPVRLHHVQEATITMLNLKSGSVNIHVHESAPASSSATRPAPRSWLIRFHLGQGELAHSITVDSKTIPLREQIQNGVAANTTADPAAVVTAVVLKSMLPIVSASPAAMPFSGAGIRPPPLAGAIIEVLVPAAGRALCDVDVTLNYML